MHARHEPWNGRASSAPSRVRLGAVPEPTIHPAALHNDLGADALRRRSDELGQVSIDPVAAGWRYLWFRTVSLGAGEDEGLDPALEHAVVVVSGGDLTVECIGTPAIALRGRSSPFEAPAEAAYVPAGVRARVVGAGSLLAIASAPPSGRSGVVRRPVAIHRRDVAVEIRGAGNATRRVNLIIGPDFPADRLLVSETYTPSGNWSSWPPHKHDSDAMPAEAVLEETYYYRFARPEAWGMQRLYRADRSRDCAWEVRSGDLALVTDGYHPFVAGHGDDAYYLNALAGDRRTLACSFDPGYDWVRQTWADMPPDPRLPPAD
jgi:5-deoxy-glucuronate isomerase